MPFIDRLSPSNQRKLGRSGISSTVRHGGGDRDEPGLSQVKSETDMTRLTVSQVIACLVRAVRCGDARMAQELLSRFSTLAELEDLMELRAALEADLRSGPDRPSFRP